MERIVKYKEPTKKAKSLGWEKVKIVTITDGRFKYKQFFNVSGLKSGHYREHLYRTIWIKK